MPGIQSGRAELRSVFPQSPYCNVRSVGVGVILVEDFLVDVAEPVF